jgi:hypothetical protein
VVPDAGGELARDRGDDLQRLLHPFVGQVADLGERLGAELTSM